jgi:hypothetical protein
MAWEPTEPTMPLTPDERHLLIALEHQLREDDPALAAVLARGPRPPRWSRRDLLLARQIALLLGALLVLAVLGPVVADRFGTAGIGIITGSLIAPWLVSSARAGVRHVDPASGARPHGSGEPAGTGREAA